MCVQVMYDIRYTHMLQIERERERKQEILY